MNHLPAFPDPSEKTAIGRPYASAELAPAVMAQQAKSHKEPSLILEYLHTIGRGWKFILVCAPLGLLAALLINASSMPLYRARTSLDVQALNQNLLSTRTAEPSSDQMPDSMESYIQTQIKLLESDTVIHLAVKRMQASPAPIQTRKPSVSGPLAFLEPKRMKRDELLGDAVNRLKVRPLGAARLIEMTCESPDPDVAAEFCNNLSQAFIEQNLRTRNDSAMSTSQWLSKQLEDVKEKLSESEKELQNEAQKSELLYANGKESVGETRLRELESELSRAQADRMVKQAQYETAKPAAMNNGPSSAESQNTRDMQMKLADLRRQLAELRGQYTDEYYRVKKLKSQIAELEASAQQEHSSSLERMRSDLVAAQQREDLLQASYHKQEGIVGAQLGATAHYELLKASVDSQRQLYQTLTQRVKEAGFATAMRSSSISVVDSAVPSKIPFSPRKGRNLATGIILGSLCGFGLVLFRQRTDSHIRLPGDAMQALNVWELGVIPAAAADRKTFSRELRSGLTLSKGSHKGPVTLMTLSGGNSLMADAYRSTMSSLLIRMNSEEKGSIFVVSSPSADEGKTTVISNLGIAFAEARRRVLLIDGDMQRPSLHKIFDLSNATGLREALRGEVNIEKTPIGLLAQPTSIPRLFVMPSGTGKESPVGLLHSQELLTLLARVRKEFDVVLIDTPPMLHMADARLFAKQGDGVVLIVRSGSTTAEEAVTAQYMFQQDFTPVIGVVLNDFHPAKEAKYRYYKSYHQYQQKN